MWHVDAVLLARGEELGLEAVYLGVHLFDVSRLADLLVDFRSIADVLHTAQYRGVGTQSAWAIPFICPTMHQGDPVTIRI